MFDQLRNLLYSLNPWQRWFLLWSCLALIFFCRSYTILLTPDLSVEDGAAIFSYFYGRDDFEAMLRYKMGYMPILANFIGFFAVKLPPPVASYVLTWLPFIYSVFTFSMPFHRRFSVCFGGVAQRFALCILLATIPYTHYHLYILTDYMIWNSLLLLYLIASIRLPRRHMAKYLIAMNFLVWFHPLSFVVTPLLIRHAIYDRRCAHWYAITILNILAAFFGARANPPEQEFQAASFLGEYLIIWRDLLFRALWGPDAYRWALESAPALLWLWLLAAIPVTAAPLLRKNTRYPWAVMAWYCLFSLAISVLGRGADYVGQINHHVRYIHPIMLMLLMVWGTMLPVSRRTQSWVMAALLLWYAAMNIPQNHHYQVRQQDNGRTMQDFLWRLWKMEKEQGHRRGIYLVLKKPDDDPVVIDTRE